MGISSGYAGQIFGLLVGLGSSMLKMTLTKGPQTFDLFNPKKILTTNLMDILVIGVALLTLTVTFVVGVINNYYLPRYLAYILLVIYSTFIIAATAIGITQAMG
jgi:hypothetical protein